MKVGWLSHQWPTPDDTPARPGLLPGRWAGGAEMLQELMRSKAPEGVEIVPVDSRGPLDSLQGCDVIVASGLELLGDEDLRRLEAFRPVLWLMSPFHIRFERLFSVGRPVWASEALRASAGFSGGPVCPGWWDTSAVPEARTRDCDALWAHRDVWHKGEGAAREWAAREGRTLTVLKNRPRPEVLHAMAGADTFVLLPTIVDPCPTAVIEAEIAGCNIVVNSLVGRTPVRGRQANIEYIEGCADRFWEYVCR